MFLKAGNWPKLLLSAALLLFTVVGFSRLPAFRSWYSPDYFRQTDLDKMARETEILGRKLRSLDNFLALPPTPGQEGFFEKIIYRVRLRIIKKKAVDLKRRLPYLEEALKTLEAEAREGGNPSGQTNRKKADLERILALQQKCKVYENHLAAVSLKLAKLYNIHLQ
jgi:hypothetical protein